MSCCKSCENHSKKELVIDILAKKDLNPNITYFAFHVGDLAYGEAKIKDLRFIPDKMFQAFYMGENDKFYYDFEEIDEDEDFIICKRDDFGNVSYVDKDEIRKIHYELNK